MLHSERRKCGAGQFRDIGIEAGFLGSRRLKTPSDGADLL